MYMCLHTSCVASLATVMSLSVLSRKKTREECHMILPNYIYIMQGEILYFCFSNLKYTFYEVVLLVSAKFPLVLVVGFVFF